MSEIDQVSRDREIIRANIADMPPYELGEIIRAPQVKWVVWAEDVFRRLLDDSEWQDEEIATLRSELEAATNALRELKRVVKTYLIPQCNKGGGEMDAPVWIDIDLTFAKVDAVLTPTPEAPDA